MRWILLSLTMFTCLLSCNGQKSNVNTQNNKPKTQPSTYKEPAPVQKFSLSLERTACFGQCPIYKMQIDAQGKVTYVGKRFVKNIGEFVKILPKDSLTVLKTIISNSDFFSLDTLYDNKNVTDLPTTILEIQLENKRNKLRARYKVPPSVPTLVKRIEQIVGETGFIAK